MSFEHSNVYIVRVVDIDDAGAVNTWFVGPYGSTRADQIADELKGAADELRSAELAGVPRRGVVLRR
jgi:hypothetical protein